MNIPALINPLIDVDTIKQEGHNKSKTYSNKKKQEESHQKN